MSTQELLCIGHPATSIERFHIYTAHIKAMLPTPEFLTLLCVPVALLVGVRLIGWILGASPLRLRLTRIQIPPEWSIVWIGVMAGCVIWLWPEQDVSLISYSWGAHDFHRELAAIVVLVTALAGLTIWLIRRKSPGTIAQARDQFGLGDQHEDSQD